MRTLLINIHLNVSEIDNMKSYLSCISWDKFCKVYNFLFCSLTCVWWSMEIYRIYPDTSLRNHITCNWTVDSTWQKKHCFSCSSKRHTAYSLIYLWINIGFFSYLHPYINIRIVHIYRKFRKTVKKIAAHLNTHLRPCVRIMLVTSLWFYLKWKIAFIVLFLYEVSYRLCHIVPVFVLDNLDRTYSCKTKHSL